MEGFAQFSWEYLGFIFKKDYEKEADLQIHVILTIINIYDTETIFFTETFMILDNLRKAASRSWTII